MAATVTVKHLADHTFTDATLDDVARLAGEPGLVWVDVLGTDRAALDRLSKQIELPGLAVEDALKPQARAKLDVYPDLLFFIWIVPSAEERGRQPAGSLKFVEIAVFVTKDLVVTAHADQVQAIKELLAGEIEVSSAESAWLVHAILDRTTDQLLDRVDAGSERLDELENSVFEKAEKTQLQRLYAIKRQLLQLRKIVQGERDVVRELARSEAWVGREAYMYYQDVGDRLARIADEVDTYFDVAVGIMDIYLSAQNNRMNQIMKQLTVVATIFMPLTLISGIYGMNLLRGMWPSPAGPWSFWIVIGSMVAIAAGMLWYFRRREWW